MGLEWTLQFLHDQSVFQDEDIPVMPHYGEIGMPLGDLQLDSVPLSCTD